MFFVCGGGERDFELLPNSKLDRTKLNAMSQLFIFLSIAPDISIFLTVDIVDSFVDLMYPSANV